MRTVYLGIQIQFHVVVVNTNTLKIENNNTVVAIIFETLLLM